MLQAAGAAHEMLHLEYAEGARLYLPVENIELLSKFGHEEGLLDRLGGGAWQAKKAKLKQRIKEVADPSDPDRRRTCLAPRADYGTATGHVGCVLRALSLSRNR